MYRPILLAAASLTSAAASGAPPEIAYAAAGTRGDAVYLVNSTGLGLTKVYQGKSASRLPAPIDAIALRSRPEGGGEVAFVEDGLTLKIIRHNETGQPSAEGAYPVAVPEEQRCEIHDIDYLANGTLIIATGCLNLWTLAPNARTAVRHEFDDFNNLHSLAAVGDSLLYIDQDTLKRLDGTTSTIVKSGLGAPYFYLDASASTAFLSDKSTFQTVGLSAPNTVSPGCTTGAQGGMVEVSPDGTEILYLYRNQMYVHASNCSGRLASRLARSVRSFAWRTY